MAISTGGTASATFNGASGSLAQSAIIFSATAFSLAGGGATEELTVTKNGVDTASFGVDSGGPRITSGGAFRFETNSVERLRITSAGLVGIGTSSPTQTLHVENGNLINASTTFGASAIQTIRGTFAGAGIRELAIGVTGDSPNNLYLQARNNSNTAQSLLLNPAGGNVGIGTSSPSQPLQVVGAIASTAQASSLTASSAFIDYNASFNGARIGSVGNTTGAAGPIYFSQYSSNASVGRDAVVIDSSGRVGIGTSSPGATLDVAGSVKTSSDIGITYQPTLGNIAAIRLGPANNQAAIGYNNDGSLDICPRGGYSVVFKANEGGTERARIDSSGRLGIGTSSPAYALDVASSVAQVGSSADAFIQYKSTAGNWHVGAGNSNAYVFYSGTYGSGVERARIDSSGRLLVGASSGTAKLEVVTSTNGDGIRLGYANTPTGSAGPAVAFAQYNNASTLITTSSIKGVLTGGGVGTESGDLVFNTAAGGAAPVERMRISGNGDVSIQNTLYLRYFGTQVSFFAYDPQGGGPTDGVAVVVNRGNDGSGSNGVGVALGRSATSWSTYSDERGKANLIPIEDGLFKVGTLRAVTGHYVEDSEQTSRSFLIAQDVQAVLPEAVDVGNPDKLGLRYTEVIPLLVAALKESKERIEALEAAVAALQQS